MLWRIKSDSAISVCIIERRCTNYLRFFFSSSSDG